MKFFILLLCGLLYQIKISFANNNTNETLSEEKSNPNNTNTINRDRFKLKNYNLTNDEIDKFMACRELANMLLEEDLEFIKSNFSHYNNSLKLEGRLTFLVYIMIQNCYYKINDTLVKSLYNNLTRDIKLKSIDDSEIDYMRVNYSELAQEEFFELSLELTRFVRLCDKAEDLFNYANMSPEEKEELRKEEEEIEKQKEKLKKEMMERKLNKTKSKENEGNFNETEKAKIRKMFDNITLGMGDFGKNMEFNEESDNKKKKEDKKNEDL